MEILSKIQTELKAPKGQFNNFGKYKYRSCEDILEAVKPLLKKHEASLTISDDIVCVGDRYYVKATATLISGKETYSVTAFAREAQVKKGMDDSQITGSTSSYARKYALNGLFILDDTKDADTQDNRDQQVQSKPSQEDIKAEIVKLCRKINPDLKTAEDYQELVQNITGYSLSPQNYKMVLQELKNHK